MRILIAEDDVSFSRLLQTQLQEEEFKVSVVPNGDDAQRLVHEEGFDLVLLDLNLPGADGHAVLQKIRAEKPELPVIIMTGAVHVDDRVRGLDEGADDYVPKPFEFAELLARIRAVLRRGARTARPVLNVEDLELDRVSHTASRAGRIFELSPREYALLEFLMQHAGHPVSRAEIVNEVWKLDLETTTNVVDVYINYLRRKVDAGHDRNLIRTVRGTGYQIGGTVQRTKPERPAAQASESV
jgi:DNA-binding response OmpR family regulator